MRRLHSVDRRRAAEILSDDDWRSGPARGHDGGESGARREIASSSGGVFERGRDAMRVLHVRHDHDGLRALAAESQSFGEPDHARDEWEHLPVRDVSAHRGGGERCGEADAGRWAMKDFAEQDAIEIAPEQYELLGRDSPRAPFEFDRRKFFQALGCGVLAICVAPALGQESGSRGRGGRGGGQAPTDVNAWLHIAEDGVITAYCGKTEVGQNVKTSMAQAVAEELRVPISSIKMLLADTDLVPYDAGTFGSQSTPQMAPRMHRAAAAAREALLDLAAEHFKVDRGSLAATDGKVTKTGGSEAITYGQLTKGQKLV